jgi:hypothetical protein
MSQTTPTPTAPTRATPTCCPEQGSLQSTSEEAGAGSVSAEAATFGREHGITVIDGGCPLMFDPTADFGHKVMRVVYRSHVPKTV